MSQMLLLVALPYAAVAAFVAGVMVRMRMKTTISSQSSQILESRWLLFGTVPFHIGILTLFLGHLVPLLTPDAWRILVSYRMALVMVESIGLTAATLCLIGLSILLVRRLASRSVRAGSTAADVLVLAVLIMQVTLGMGVAVMHRWGSVWAVGTVVPYLRSLIALRPDPTFVAAVPPMVMWHLTGAWIVLALLPFTRLVHILTFPVTYLTRPLQKVVWMTPHQAQRPSPASRERVARSAG